VEFLPDMARCAQRIKAMIDREHEGLLRHATEGSPQGGAISPCLSNIFLHHVLDEWFESEVRPHLTGRCTLIRFADDAVLAFEDFLDAKRVLGVLGKRLARYGLTLHPDKTRFVDFRNNRPNGTDHPETNGTSFTFLGFTHIWGKSRAGKKVVRQEGATRPRTLALFPEDRCEGLLPDEQIVRLKLSQLQLRRPRQWGACWLGLKLWEELHLDRFWAERLEPSRKGTR
jgi:hypothetical protein